MSSRALTRAVLVVIAATLVGLVVVNLNAQPHAPKQPARPAMGCGCCGMSAAAAPAHGGSPTTHPAHGGMHRCMRMKQAMVDSLNTVTETLDAAAAAVRTGDSETALAKLAHAKGLVEKNRQFIQNCCGVGKPGAPVNIRCPMMGSAIDPEKVPANLRRQFHGRTVGFCCAGCPAAWDKLTEGQKKAKLAACMPKAKMLNTRCPIMGSKIDPANVPTDLTRSFGGGKVGFCCPGCPAMWDKLTDEQKKAKLQAAAGK